MTRQLARVFFIATFSVLSFAATDVFGQGGPFQFFPLTPCRLVDTRDPVATNGGPKFGSDATRNFTIRGRCGVPLTAKAVSLNVTVTAATQQSFLSVWPSNLPRPFVSMLNFEASDPALANGIVVGVSTLAQDLSVYNNFGAVHVILDVTGYFQ